MRRPVLKPALDRVWRSDDTLQIGLDPDRAVVLGGLDGEVAEWLETLDGTRTRDQLLAGAAAAGIEPATAGRLLDLLGRAGLLDDASRDHRALRGLGLDDRERLAPDLASLSLRARTGDGGASRLSRRLGSAVTIHGAGRVGASLACLLAAAGVGHVVVFDHGRVRLSDLAPGGLTRGQVGTQRATATATALRRVAPAVHTRLPGRRNHPDLAVFAAVGAPDHGTAASLRRAGVPHLTTSIRETTGVVGPLVLPGQSCCVRCLDLHRSDRDPDWPRVAAQLSSPVHPARSLAGGPACDIGLAAAVAAQTALHVLAFLDGELPPSVNGTIEISLPYGLTRRRSWQPHPGCDCRQAAGRRPNEAPERGA
ncbi:MAG: ThiF family adenylyltransferase [Sporichthyaceae bacterium]|nr:ThiF family adenylyltransferase [Sporichthyaceae bacterium]